MSLARALHIPSSIAERSDFSQVADNSSTALESMDSHLLHSFAAMFFGSCLAPCNQSGSLGRPPGLPVSPGFHGGLRLARLSAFGVLVGLLTDSIVKDY